MSDRTRRGRLLLVLLFVASLAIITIDFRNSAPIDAAGRAVMTVLGPLQEGARKVFRPVGNFFAGFTEVASLKARVGSLENRNALLLQREEQVSDIERENANLRSLLGIRQRLNVKTLAARVVGVGPSNFEDSVFLDRGSADGVRKDMPIVGGEGLIGRVIQVSAHSSRVTLIIDPSSSVAARLGTSGRTGIVSGTGQRELRFEVFDPESSVSAGDTVVTSGYDKSVYPAGIPIGTVTRIEPEARSLSRIVYLTPYVDLTSLDFVLIVTGGAA